jgi:hypothetical protein
LALFTETAGAWAAGVQPELPANAGGTPQAELDAMACPSAGNCSAVGSYRDNTGSQQGLLLDETDGTWSPAIEAPLPANALSFQLVGLLAVSCVSTGNCTAAGAYLTNDTSGLGGLLLTETDGTWATGVEATLPPNGVRPDPPIGITSVSCVSVGNCTVVGGYTTTSGASEGLVLTETNGSWAPGIEVQPPANASASAYLNDVECSSVGNCSAIGSYTDNSDVNREGLLVTETTGTWSPAVEAVLPANAATTQQQVFVSPPACASAGECATVASYIDGSGATQQMLLTETGGAWSPGIQPPLPPNAATTNPQGGIAPPSCPSAGNCSDGGAYHDNSGNSEGLLLTQTGASWSPSEAILPANAATTGQEAGVRLLSCPSTGNCRAAGSYVDDSGDHEGLLLTETSGTWAAEEAAVPANAKTPDASPAFGVISCPSAGSCTAAGSYADASSEGGTDILFLGGSAPTVKVDVSTAGTGTGAVSSAPDGIDCGSTCSTSLEAGALLTLTATASQGSRFSGWSGGSCTGTGTCQVDTGVAGQTVTATFNLLPKCVVPEVKGKRLTSAERAVRAHNCTVGRIKRAASRKIKKGHVIAQRPKPGKRLKHDAKISFVVSKGRR